MIDAPNAEGQSLSDYAPPRVLAKNDNQGRTPGAQISI
jgi:hypothetical protein